MIDTLAIWMFPTGKLSETFGCSLTLIKASCSGEEQTLIVIFAIHFHESVLHCSIDMFNLSSIIYYWAKLSLL